MSRRRFKSATGQALILVALAMPLFFSVVGLVIAFAESLVVLELGGGVVVVAAVLSVC